MQTKNKCPDGGIGRRAGLKHQWSNIHPGSTPGLGTERLTWLSQPFFITNQFLCFMKNRIAELDYLKSIFILLMIVFHLVYIGDKYPYAKALVYTFHMPAFLIISGYVMNIAKGIRPFLRTMWWIFIPYAVMETGYVIMSAVLPVRESVEHLSVSLWLDKLFLHPLGPYWYLHTLMLCGLVYLLVDKLAGKWSNTFSVLIILALSYAVLSVCGILSLINALYFTAGVALRRSSIDFRTFFSASFWALLPVIWLAADETNLNKSTLSGAALTYLVISFLLAVYRYLPDYLKKGLDYIGSHTFVLLVFSPVFTMAVKPLVPVLAFEPTGMLFLCVSLCFCVMGSFAIAWVMDKLDLSRFFWGKSRMLS